MYKNLNASVLGVYARQTELIETALTYGFRGVDIDISDVVKRAKSLGLDTAAQLLNSAKLKIGGFDLPVRWKQDEPTFFGDLKELAYVAEVAQKIGAAGCFTTISPTSPSLPYHENFELHRKRLAQIADVLAERDLHLGLAFQAAARHRLDGNYQFIHQAEAVLTLLKTISATNVGLVLDTWDWYVGGGGLDQIRELSVNQIVAVRLANLPPQADTATVDEDTRLLPDEDGVIDAIAVLKFLNQIHYSGPVAAFPHPSVFAGMTRDDIVARTRDCLDHLWKEAGINKAGKREAVGSKD